MVLRICQHPSFTKIRFLNFAYEVWTLPLNVDFAIKVGAFFLVRGPFEAFL